LGRTQRRTVPDGVSCSKSRFGSIALSGGPRRCRGGLTCLCAPNFDSAHRGYSWGPARSLPCGARERLLPDSSAPMSVPSASGGLEGRAIISVTDWLITAAISAASCWPSCSPSTVVLRCRMKEAMIAVMCMRARLTSSSAWVPSSGGRDPEGLGRTLSRRI
jgi:hypothetical protein